MAYIARPVEVLESNVLETFKTELFIPQELAKDELFTIVSETIDYLIQSSSNAPETFEKIINHVENKYVDSLKIVDQDVTEELIKEDGYQYLLDVDVDFSTDDKIILFNYLKLIHFLKGSRLGLELVLRLLNYDARIMEWWEQNPKAPENTFDIYIELFDQSTLSKGDLKSIRDFTRNYVYPLLRYVIQVVRLIVGTIGIAQSGYVDREYVFSTSFATYIVNMGGFIDYESVINILGIVPTYDLNQILNLNPSLITTNSFDLSWSNILGTTNYLLEVSTDFYFDNIIGTYNINTTNITVNSLNSSTKYFYRMRIINTLLGDSFWSHIYDLITL